MTERDPGRDVEPFAVRPAVVQHVPHALEPRPVDGFPRIQADDADDPAHGRVA